MQPHVDRHLPIKGTYNVRDLGGYAAATGKTRFRRVLRADGLHRLDADGMAVLVREGVTTVIDLRHPGELVTHPNPFGTGEVVHYHNVSLFDRLEPMTQSGGDQLLELYKLALAERGAAIAHVLTTIARAPAGAVLFHCTAGKDRTGIVAALLLATAGVEVDAIVADYAETGARIAPMVEEIIASATARGTDAEAFRPLLASDPATMAATIAHLEAEHGSVRQYLATIGLDDATIDALNARLLGEA